MSHIQTLSSMIEPNGKTVRENNLQILHSLRVGDKVSVFVEDYKQEIEVLVLDLTRDCDGETLYVLSPSSRVRENYPRWRRTIDDPFETEENKRYVHFEMMTAAILNGYSRESLQLDSETERNNASRVWQYKHTLLGNLKAHFDYPVSESRAHQIIIDKCCPEEQLVPGTVYPAQE